MEAMGSRSAVLGSAGLFGRFLEFAPDAIVGVDAAGNIVAANVQVERIFGYARDELLGAPVELLVPERFRAVHPGHRGGYFADPRTRPMGAELELFGQRKDGSEFPAEISLSSVETDDGALAIAAVRDITERQADLARRLRAGLPELKILFVSGYSELDISGAIRDTGGDFLAKPFGTDALRDKVAELLDP